MSFNIDVTLNHKTPNSIYYFTIGLFVFVRSLDLFFHHYTLYPTCAHLTSTSSIIFPLIMSLNLQRLQLQLQLLRCNRHCSCNSSANDVRVSYSTEGQKRWKRLADICCQPLQWCRAPGGNATRHCIHCFHCFHCTAVTMFYHLISTIKTNPCERGWENVP